MIELPFERVWFGTEIPNYREGKGTYTRFPLAGLPTMPAEGLDGTFAWLSAAPRMWARSEHDDELAAKLAVAIDQARQLNLDVPASFLRFMQDWELQARVYSITGSFWKVDTFEPCPGTAGYVLLFRSDSQASVLWYLYLEPGSTEHAILASFDYFGSEVEHYGNDPQKPQQLFVCADSFAEFVYREWVEHTAWNHIMTARPLSERERAYVDFYRPAGDQSDRRLQCKLHHRPLEPCGQVVALGADCNYSEQGIAHRLHSFQWKQNGENYAELARNAALFKFHFWKQDQSVCLDGGDHPYCPECRQEYLRFLRDRGYEKLLGLLQDKLGIAIG